MKVLRLKLQRNIKKLNTVAMSLLILSYACSSNSENEDSIIDSNKTYSIVYEGNGHTAGNVPIDEMKYVNNDKTAVLPNTTLVKEGYIFNGWNTMANGSGDDYEENSNFIFTTSNVVLYAQWLSEVVYHELISSNVNVIDILNAAPLSGDNLYHATVDIINGSLTLNDSPSNSKFQFQYNGLNGISPENKGYLKVKYNSGFHTASNDGRALGLTAGSTISSSTFLNAGVAEISGLGHNWGDKTNVYIPVRITIDSRTHYGYIKASFKDAFGQLIIHATAYNMIPEKEIIAGQQDK